MQDCKNRKRLEAEKHGGHMRSFLKYLDRHLEENVCGLILVILIILTNVEVFRRYFLNSPGAYTEEIIRYLLVAMIFFGMAYVVRVRKHIVCNVIPSSMNQKLQYAFYVVMTILCLLFHCLMLYASYTMVINQMLIMKTAPAMGIPMWPVSSVTICGFFLCIIRTVQVFIEDTRSYLKTGIAYNPGISMD